MKPLPLILLPLLGVILLLQLASSPAHAQSDAILKVTGLSGSALDNVRTLLAPEGDLFHEGDFNALWLNRYLRLAPGRVRKALEPFGYYQPQVEIKVERQGTPTINIQVDPGPPVVVASRQLEVLGEQPPALGKQLAKFPLTPGSVLEHQPYEKAKAELLALAVDLGYLDAHYTRHRIEVDPAGNSATVDLQLELGQRFRFGETSFSGGDEYPERFLRRYLTLRRGKLFSFAELGQTQRQLLDSDRFSSVVISPQRGQALGDEVPVKIGLETKPSKRVRPGVGYGTDTGARFFMRYQDVNLFGLGHELTGDLLLAQRQQNLIGSYLVPGYRNVDTMLAFRGGYQAEQLASYDTRYLFAEAEQLYGFGKGRVGSVFVRFQQESSTISGTKITTGTLIPGVRLRLRQLDDPLWPRRGYQLALEARGTSTLLGSEFSMLQLLADGNWLLPLPWRSVLQLRGNYATTLEKNEFNELPASLRFFAGGDRSVRGYAYQSLGPTDASGAVVGGKQLLAGSVEVEKRFLQSWGAAVFYDVGNAFDSLKLAELAQGAGVGLRYFTPVGPIRVDLARTIGAVQDGYRIHIGLGVGW